MTDFDIRNFEAIAFGFDGTLVSSSGVDERPGASRLVGRLSVHLPGRLAIVSTAEETEVLPFLLSHKLIKYFPVERLILAEHPRVGEPKLAPEAYQVAAEKMRVSLPERMLVIEGSEPGVEAGKRMGATVVAVAHTRTPEALLAVEPELQPNAIVPDLDGLAELVGLNKLVRC